MDDSTLEFLSALQKIHDCTKPGTWEFYLREFTEVYSLVWPQEETLPEQAQVEVGEPDVPQVKSAILASQYDAG